ncbi:Uncharacterised protein r2_g4277 [Pycnogonum litorale]
MAGKKVKKILPSSQSKQLYKSVNRVLTSVQKKARTERIPVVEFCNAVVVNDVVGSESPFMSVASSVSEVTSNTCIQNNNFENDLDSESEVLINKHDATAMTSQNISESSDLRMDLKKWAVTHKISQLAFNYLLAILRPVLKNLPKDCRTLLGISNNKCTTDSIAGGDFYYFGLLNSIKLYSLHLTSVFPSGCTLQLQINVDGLPIFKSSTLQIWPILGMLTNNEGLKPFVIAVFGGKNKPNCLDSFFQHFIEEYTSLRTGFELAGVHFKLDITAFICDAPARAYIKCIKGHGSYYGCGKCNQCGMYFKNRVVFQETESSPRTDESFRLMLDEDHHTGMSPLLELGIGMVSKFPLDYMHLVCLGVTRKLLKLWMKGPLRTRLSSRTVNLLSEELKIYSAHIPSEFNRKCRALTEVDRFKATEFRLFLLYTGPVVLLNKLVPTSIYRNFMLLSVAIRILCKATSEVDELNFAKELLKNFIQHFSNLYGKQYVSYNVHSLLHLTDDVKIHGSLDAFSCFPFENFLMSMKKMVRKPNQVVSQMVKRELESRCVNLHISPNNVITGRVQEFKKPHQNGPLPNALLGTLQYKHILFRKMVLKTYGPDQYVCIENNVCKIRNILKFDGNCFIMYSIFESSGFISYPDVMDSLQILKVCNLGENIYHCDIHKVEYKYVMLPKDSYFVAIPMLNFN